jgi:hypothetical protein
MIVCSEWFLRKSVKFELNFTFSWIWIKHCFLFRYTASNSLHTVFCGILISHLVWHISFLVIWTKLILTLSTVSSLMVGLPLFLSFVTEHPISTKLLCHLYTECLLGRFLPKPVWKFPWTIELQKFFFQRTSNVLSLHHCKFHFFHCRNTRGGKVALKTDAKETWDSNLSIFAFQLWLTVTGFKKFDATSDLFCRCCYIVWNVVGWGSVTSSEIFVTFLRWSRQNFHLILNYFDRH